MFVDPKKTVKITIYVREVPDGRVLVRRHLAGLTDLQKNSFQSVTFELRLLNWRQKNDVYRESRTKDPVTMNEVLDWESFKQNHLIHLLASWDIKDEKGNPVPLTPDNITNLPAAIPEMVLSIYDEPEVE